MTPSDVAENTRMMVQVVESLEREDFRRIAAPIYGRGFIKLYAELLELDPEPLIRDFMELYDGARAPAVKTKKVEAPEEPVAVTPPVTRTVSGPAPLAPQRQPVQPRPAIRPVVVAPAAEAVAPAAEAVSLSHDKPEPVGVKVEEEAPQRNVPDAVQAEEPSFAPAAERPRALVVEPEEPQSESDEPDLFRPAPPRRAAVSREGDGESPSGETERASRKSPKLPVFKIGGRMEQAAEPAPHDEEAHARRHARVQAFLDGFSKLKDGVGSRLPEVLPRKQMLALGGAGVVALVVLAAGVSVLFKLTGANVKETPGVIIETTPPPALYVD